LEERIYSGTGLWYESISASFSKIQANYPYRAILAILGFRRFLNENPPLQEDLANSFNVWVDALNEARDSIRALVKGCRKGNVKLQPLPALEMDEANLNKHPELPDDYFNNSFVNVKTAESEESTTRPSQVIGQTT
jgi:hypothetical protein